MQPSAQHLLMARPQRISRMRRVAAVAAVGGALMAGLTTFVPSANAADVDTVPLATTESYSVLAGTTVTNTNASVLDASVGLSPGTSVIGFPPGIVNPPGIIDATSATALQAQSDLTLAYVDAAGRSVDFVETNPDLVGKTLIPGVYAATAKAPLSLSGQLVLDGQNLPDPVFIFQTDSTLITGSASSIALINGANECDVFWQVGSSATLGSGSTFVGNILALTSITVESGVTVHGRALARNGAVTLDNDVFSAPDCEPTTEVEAPATTTTIAATTTTVDTGTTVDAGATTVATTPGTLPTDSTTPGGVFGPSDTSPSAATTTPVTGIGTNSTTPAFDDTDITLPVTGSTTSGTAPIAGAALLIGAAALLISRRRTTL